VFGGVIAEYFVFSAVDTAKSKNVPSGLFGLHRKARFWTESSAPGGRREARNRFKRGAGGFPASVEIPSEILFFRVGLSLRLSKDLSRAFSGDRYRILSKVARLSPVYGEVLRGERRLFLLVHRSSWPTRTNSSRLVATLTDAKERMVTLR
jgi:hypothetical protein